VVDRVGKGIRGAPRDALVADITPAHLRGAAYGLRQSLDTVGAFLGPLLAVTLMLLWADTFARYSGQHWCQGSSPSRYSLSVSRSLHGSQEKSASIQLRSKT
jgi:MFS family permease